MTQKAHYFLVRAKCGHVGREYYIPLVFPVQAENASAAAAKVRCRGGVKHEHPDAIQWVRKVSREDFDRANLEFDNDPYWKGARNNGGLLHERLCREPRTFNLPYAKSESGQFRFRKYKVMDKEFKREIAAEFRITL